MNTSLTPTTPITLPKPDNVFAILGWTASQLRKLPPDKRFPYDLKDGFLALPPKAFISFLKQCPGCPFKVPSSSRLEILLARAGLLAERNASRATINHQEHWCVLIPMVKVEDMGIFWPSRLWTAKGTRRGYRR